MAMRKVALHGAWWGQRRDGSWVRWDPARADWAPAPAPAGAPPPPVFAIPVSTGTHGWEVPSPLAILLDLLLTYLSMLVPGAGMLLLAYPVLVIVALMSPWLFSPFDPGAVMAGVAQFLSVYLAFFTAAVVTVRRAHGAWAVPAWAAGLGLVFAGSRLSATLVGLRDETLLAGINRATILALVALGLFALLERGLQRLTGRAALVRPRLLFP